MTSDQAKRFLTFWKNLSSARHKFLAKSFQFAAPHRTAPHRLSGILCRTPGGAGERAAAHKSLPWVCGGLW